MKSEFHDPSANVDDSTPPVDIPPPAVNSKKSSATPIAASQLLRRSRRLQSSIPSPCKPMMNEIISYWCLRDPKDSVWRDVRLQGHKGTVSLTDDYGLPCPKNEVFKAIDLETGKARSVWVPPSQYGTRWKFKDYVPSPEDADETFLIATALSAAITNVVLTDDIPIPRDFFDVPYSLERLKHTRDPHERPWEKATNSIQYKDLGGTPATILADIEAGKVKIVTMMGVPIMSTFDVKSAILNGLRLDKIDPTVPSTDGTTTDQKTRARQFCAESADILFNGLGTENRINLDELADYYAAHVVPNVTRSCTDKVEKLFATDVDPNYDWKFDVDDFDFTNIEGLFLKYIDANDIECDPEQIRDPQNYTTEQRVNMTKAILSEIGGLCDRNTFALSIVPPGRKAISSKLVLKIKMKADGSLDKFKARLVARGFLQSDLAGDFYVTRAPMASLATGCTVISIGVKHGLPIHHMDIPQAYIQSVLDREVWMNLPSKSS